MVVQPAESAHERNNGQVRTLWCGSPGENHLVIRFYSEAELQRLANGELLFCAGHGDYSIGPMPRVPDKDSALIS